MSIILLLGFGSSVSIIANLFRCSACLGRRKVSYPYYVILQVKPEAGTLRRSGCMGTMYGALPLPGFGSKVAAKTKVDYQNTPEGLLVQRAQAGEEAAFREIVERYQSKVFSIIHGIVRQRNDVEDIAQQVL